MYQHIQDSNLTILVSSYQKKLQAQHKVFIKCLFTPFSGLFWILNRTLPSWRAWAYPWYLGQMLVLTAQYKKHSSLALGCLFAFLFIPIAMRTLNFMKYISPTKLSYTILGTYKQKGIHTQSLYSSMKFLFMSIQTLANSDFGVGRRQECLRARTGWVLAAITGLRHRESAASWDNFTEKFP